MLTAELWDVSGLDSGDAPSKVADLGHFIKGGFQDVLSEAGTGTVVVHTTHALASEIWGHERYAIRFNFDVPTRGNRAFEWFIDDANNTIGSTKPENRLLSLTGRGMLAYLERGVLAMGGSNPLSWTTPTQTYGATMLDFINQATARGALLGLYEKFSASGDSNDPYPPGQPWASGTHSLQFHSGINGYDLLMQLCALGPEAFGWLNTAGSPPGQNHVQLDLFNERGQDRSSSVIFRLPPWGAGGPSSFGYGAGGDQTDLTLHRQMAQARSAILVEGQGTIIWHERSDLLARWGRRETYLSFPQGGSDTSELANAGDNALQILAQETLPIQATVRHGSDPSRGLYEPYVDYFLGDTVTLDAPPFLSMAKYRVVGITIGQKKGADYSVTLDLNSIMLDSLIRLQKQIAGMQSA